MSTRFLSLACLAVAGLYASTARGDDRARLPAWEASACKLIVLDERETKWQQIPWTRDLEKAVKQAREEKRPLLLWVTGDEPLERC
jgi:hypothetical protein